MKKEQVETLLDTKFVKVFDLQYAPGRHYYDATRHCLEDLTALKEDGEFRTMTADAATCFVILVTPQAPPRLVLQYEYRYPAGHFLLSPPAGLCDKEDGVGEAAVIACAKREIFEETGLAPRTSDRCFIVSPLVFSSPGLTDESNALVCAVLEREDESELNNAGAEGTECFDGFALLTKEEAARVLKNGKDPGGNPYSVYTWCALMYFVSDLWKEEEHD